MTLEPLAAADEHEERYDEVYRFYQLAKRAEWQVAGLPWTELEPIPVLRGSPQRMARRKDIWRSVITQQLQADELAVEMAAQLFSMASAPHSVPASPTRSPWTPTGNTLPIASQRS